MWGGRRGKGRRKYDGRGGMGIIGAKGTVRG